MTYNDIYMHPYTLRRSRVSFSAFITFWSQSKRIWILTDKRLYCRVGKTKEIPILIGKLSIDK